MKLRLPFPVGSASPMSPRVRQRVVLAGVALVALLLALVLHAYAQRRVTDAQEAALRSAWSQRGAVAAVAIDSNAVFTRFAMRQTGGSNEITWKVANVAELRSSLLALESAGTRLGNVRISREGAAFNIVAERAP